MPCHKQNRYLRRASDRQLDPKKYFSTYINSNPPLVSLSPEARTKRLKAVRKKKYYLNKKLSIALSRGDNITLHSKYKADG